MANDTPTEKETTSGRASRCSPLNRAFIVVLTVLTVVAIAFLVVLHVSVALESLDSRADRSLDRSVKYERGRDQFRGCSPETFTAYIQ